MYAVFVDDGFDKLFKTKEDAKAYAREVRSEQDGFNHRHTAYVHKLTKAEREDFGC